MLILKPDHTFDVSIKLETELLFGNLTIPKNAKAIVLFAHGSGSSRFSSRNRYVAEQLNKAGLGTLLFDLLTEEEDKIDNITSEFRFNIPLLAERLKATTDWVLEQPELSHYKIGYFGSSTGAAAALIAAAQRTKEVNAIVSRGGRPDLADVYLKDVIAPTLLIVGELDPVVIQLNQDAQAKLTNAYHLKLAIVNGATHLFEEPGKLDEVVILACDWFKQWLL
jgi:putative phosphoribosyl transferase